MRNSFLSHNENINHDFSPTPFSSGAFGLLTFLTLTLIMSGISFLAGQTLLPIIPLASLIVGCFVSWRSGGWKSVVIMLIIIVLSFAVTLFTFDASTDSISYHKWAVYYLSHGWNPFYQDDPSGILWVMHYSKGQELLSASIATLTGVTETGRCINIIYFIACSILSYRFIQIISPTISKRHLLFVTLALILNPVSVAQLLAFYNDGFLFPGITLLSLTLICYNNLTYHKGVFMTIAVMISIILINTKFTHFFYCGLTWVLFYIYQIWKKDFVKLWRMLLCGFAALVIGVVVVGWNPYITNTLQEKDPFYPLLSKKVDIMTRNTPDIYKNDTRFMAFIKAQVSTDDESWGLLKHPLSIKNYFSTRIDARTLGFGPFFWLLLILSLVLVISSAPPRTFVIMFLISILCCFIFYQAWWARYAPFAWATIAISVYASYMKNKCIRLRKIILLGVFVNISFVALRCNIPPIIHSLQLDNVKRISQHYSTLAINIENAPILEKQLKEKGIRNTISVPYAPELSQYIIVGNPNYSIRHPMMFIDEKEVKKIFNDPLHSIVFEKSKITNSF